MKVKLCKHTKYTIKELNVCQHRQPGVQLFCQFQLILNVYAHFLPAGW